MDNGRGPTRPRGRVIVVGSINVDLVLQVPHLPHPGETVTGGTFARHHGGKGANQAVAAARAGATAFAIGAIGDAGRDGQDCLAALARAGVNVSGVARLAGQATGHAVVIVAASGENQIAVAPGANAAVTADHVRRSLGALAVTPADVIVLSFELGDAPLLAAAAAARQAGAALVVNPAPAREYDPDLLRGAVVTPNRQELMTLAAAGGSPQPGAAARGGAAASGTGADAGLVTAASELSARAGGPVIATLGERGALLADATVAEFFPGHAVTARDTTGAGDTLTGVLAASLAAGSDLRSALRRGVAAAALAVTRVGARAGMPAAGEIDALLAGRSREGLPPQEPRPPAGG